VSDPTAPILRLRQADLHSRGVDGEVVALDMADSEYLAVNASGAPLWEALGAGTTRDDLVTLLRERHGLELAEARHDVDAFLTQLRERRLLEETAPEAG
jgi:hypothetical protein